MSAATKIPTFVPELKMPVASARSFLGNHSATVLIEAGKAPASPRPRANRASASPMAVPVRVTIANPVLASRFSMGNRQVEPASHPDRVHHPARNQKSEGISELKTEDD